MDNFAIRFLQLLNASRQISDLEQRQIRLIYTSVCLQDGKQKNVRRFERHEDLANWADCEDSALLLFLTLLFAQLHCGSTLLEDNEHGQKIEDSLLQFVKLALELDDAQFLNAATKDLPNSLKWTDTGEVIKVASNLLNDIRARCSQNKLPSWLLQREEELNSNSTTYPFIIARKDGFSFQRHYFAERSIRQYITKRLHRAVPPLQQLPDILKQILVDFPPQNANGKNVTLHMRQAVAVVIACTNPTCIISGGPGTGKTTVVTQVLRALVRMDTSLCIDDIALAAPTGRAAARLQESIVSSLGIHPQSADKPLKNLRGKTMHTLLGYNGHTGLYTYTEKNPLPYKLVVIDETSMIDLSLFALFLGALASDCRLLLLGDRGQLPSVDAGAVLGDLTSQAYADINRGTLSEQAFKQVETILNPLGVSIDQSLIAQKFGHPLEDHMVVLTKSHRFEGSVGDLANAVSNGEIDKVREVFASGDPVVECLQLPIDQILANWQNEHFPSEWSTLACTAFKNLPANTSIDPQSTEHTFATKLLAMQNSARILCVVKNDVHGVETINKKMLDRIYKFSNNTFDNDFAGMPIMMGQNAAALGLYNGDTGILVQTGGGLSLLIKSAGNLRLIPKAILPTYTLAFAMTVHKAQGSEYQHVLLMLPEKDNAILTREILFTAITRTKERFSLAGWSEGLVARWLKRTIHRKSGLLDF